MWTRFKNWALSQYIGYDMASLASTAVDGSVFNMKFFSALGTWQAIAVASLLAVSLFTLSDLAVESFFKSMKAKKNDKVVHVLKYVFAIFFASYMGFSMFATSFVISTEREKGNLETANEIQPVPPDSTQFRFLSAKLDGIKERDALLVKKDRIGSMETLTQTYLPLFLKETDRLDKYWEKENARVEKEREKIITARSLGQKAREFLMWASVLIPLFPITFQIAKCYKKLQNGEYEEKLSVFEYIDAMLKGEMDISQADICRLTGSKTSSVSDWVIKRRTELNMLPSLKQAEKTMQLIHSK